MVCFGIQVNEVTMKNVTADCTPVDKVDCDEGRGPVRLPNQCCAKCMWYDISGLLSIATLYPKSNKPVNNTAYESNLEIVNTACFQLSKACC